MQKNSIIFFGTPSIAADVLSSLLSINANVIAVVTKPDSPVGRGQNVAFSKVKEVALENNILIFQPTNLTEVIDKINGLNADILITCAYGKIIPREIFSHPKYKCVNIHTSLLPKYRGGAPIQHALLNREKETGITLMYTAEKLDSGNIIYQETITVVPGETYETLYKKLSELSCEIISKKLDYLMSDEVTSSPQNENEVSLAPIIKRQDEKIDWSKTADEIDAKVRALYNVPIAYTTYGNLNIKIHNLMVLDTTSDHDGGIIAEISKKGIIVNTGSKQVLITKLQMPSKRPMFVSETINGTHPFIVNEKFN